MLNILITFKVVVFKIYVFLINQLYKQKSNQTTLTKQPQKGALQALHTCPLQTPSKDLVGLRVFRTDHQALFCFSETKKEKGRDL